MIEHTEETLHPQVEVSLDGELVLVDEELAPLIEALWQDDIITALSCQDNFPAGYVWIHFVSPYDAQRFLDKVVSTFDSEYGSLWYRAYETRDDIEGDDAWIYRAHVCDMNADMVELDGDEIEFVSVGRPESGFSMSIRFPHSDLAHVERAFKVPSRTVI